MNKIRCCNAAELIHSFMASFDFVESAAKGYRFFWHERRAIARVMAVPLAIKLLCFFGITALGDEQNFLRQGLFLIPSYFAEGWLMAQLIRMAIFKEGWPVRFSGNHDADMALHLRRKRAILSGMVIYVLIKLALAFTSGYVLTAQLALRGGLEGGAPDAQPMMLPTPPEPSLTTFILGLCIFAFLIWAFRLAWLYVPAVMERSVSGFLNRIKPYSASFPFLGAWILCFIPAMLVLLALLKVMTAVFPVVPDAQNGLQTYMVITLQALFDMITAGLVSVSIAYGVKSIYDGTNKPTPLL